MLKNYNEYFDETYYTETLDNGLRVIIFHKPDFISSTCAFGTSYGGLNIHQKIGDQEYHFHPGVAHFLEHKLFENEELDVTSQFSAMGASCNAFTSYNETVYYFSKGGEDIEDCLNLLLDFVQDLQITDASVEKEKGIIAQELAMYLEMPDSNLVHETYKSLYHNYPLIHDIGGEKETVYQITKKELEECYEINYHPQSMLLMITTFLEPEKLMKIIRANQKKKSFLKLTEVTDLDCHEPLEVNRKEYSFHMNVSKNKQVYAFKFSPSFKDAQAASHAEWCMRFLLEAHFSTLNPEYQKWLDEGIINDFFGYEVDFDKDYALLMFYIENDDPNVLKDLIDGSLKKKLLTEELLTQIKRRYIGISFDAFNDVENFDLSYIRDYINGIDYFKSVEDLQNITVEECYKVFESFDYQHSVIVNLVKNDQ